jgi:hypothetical protein
MKYFRIAMLAVLVVCLLPFLSLFVSLAVAGFGQCQLDEGSVHPCLIGGVDLGPTLYVMSVSAWFGLMTLPLLLAAAVLWAAAELVHWRRGRVRAG